MKSESFSLIFEDENVNENKKKTEKQRNRLRHKKFHNSHWITSGE